MGTFNRRRLAVAALSMAALWASGAVQAQTWNLYTTNPATGQAFVAGPTVTFPKAMSASNGATVNLSFGGTVSNAGFNMDTGSNGILISARQGSPGEAYFDGTGATFLGTGSETLTSSGITYHGNLYQTDVAINDANGTKVATSKVTVLAVTSTSCATNARSCTPATNPTGIKYMGIGIAPTRDGVLMGFGANTAIAEATSVYLRYEGTVAGQDSSHAFTAGLRMTW